MEKVKKELLKLEKTKNNGHELAQIFLDKINSKRFNKNKDKITRYNIHPKFYDKIEIK